MIAKETIVKHWLFLCVWNEHINQSKSYKKEINLLKQLNIGVFIKNTPMWGNGL